MTTEITDSLNTASRDWVCYDAECALCGRWAERTRALLEKHGFVLLPLQSAPVRAALRLPEDELLAEMRVVTRDGRVFGGADALVYLGGFISQPISLLTRIPGTKALLRIGYRFLASHRNCRTGACRMPGAFPRPADWLPLPALVLATAVIGRYLPAWLYMWLLALALFAGCKWLCLQRELAKGVKAGLEIKLGFLFGWIGMDAAEFLARKRAAQPPRAAEWGFATLKIVMGAILLWTVTRRALAVNDLLAGWTAMVGLIFILHFGLFLWLALAWRAAGFKAEPLMRAPLLARSLGEFWGDRWNTAFNQLATTFLFRPLRRKAGVREATMFVFLISGLVHDLVISVPARGGYGLPTLYFLLQGMGVLFEHTRFARRCGLGRGFRGWVFTLIVTAGPVFWLFHPPFIRNVILPFLKCIGAT